MANVSKLGANSAAGQGGGAMRKLQLLITRWLAWFEIVTVTSVPTKFCCHRQQQAIETGAQTPSPLSVMKMLLPRQVMKYSAPPTSVRVLFVTTETSNQYGKSQPTCTA